MDTPGEPTKQLPKEARQHATAGPYSPVLIVDSRHLVVISGQVAVADDGEVIGETIEAQTTATLDNCARQLGSAGCTFADVFKVNIYMTDLADWPAVNAIYRDRFPEPFPVRTAVQAVLLPGFRIEIEMWAARRP